MEMRKTGARIRKSMIPKIYDHEAYQTRMISVVDYEEGKLNIAVMESKDQKKVTSISIDLNSMPPLDKFDLHRKTTEMVNMDAMIASLGNKKLQTINDKLRTQLKNQKLATRTRQIRVEELEKWIIELGVSPKDKAFVQALIKSKDKEIQVLKQKLKIPGIDHVQTPELQAIQAEKDHLVMKMVEMGEKLKCTRSRLKT
jgi:hypothetical protein